MNAVTPRLRTAASVVAPDTGDVCVDVGRARGCWHSVLTERASPVTRTLPLSAAATEMGWVCDGQREQRKCHDRVQWAGEFTCDGESCVQHGPRLPSSADWTCFEVAGAVSCYGGEPAAGVPEAPASPGYLCGQRRGTNDRVCIDFSPDVPSSADGWKCEFVQEPTLQRHCRREENISRLGIACSSEQPCVDGSRCASGVCLPSLPRPECVFDKDCAPQVCRFARCSPKDSP
jgi:hypothetical protein